MILEEQELINELERIVEATREDPNNFEMPDVLYAKNIFKSSPG